MSRYNLRSRTIVPSVLVNSERTTSIENASEINADKNFLRCIVDEMRKTIESYENLEYYRKENEGSQMLFCLRRYLTQLVYEEKLELNEINKNLPIQYALAEAKLFIMKYDLNLIA